MQHIKVMKYQITKPINIEWGQLNSILNALQKETMVILNKTIQLCWEYQGFSSDYKNLYNKDTKIKEVLGYSNIQGYIYDKFKEDFYKLNKGNQSQTIRRATDKWSNDLKEIQNGKRSVPNFKDKNPIDIVGKNIRKINKRENEYILTLSLVSEKFRQELELKTGTVDLLIKAHDQSQQKIMERLLNSTYKIGVSQILKVNKKWFLNLTYKLDTEKTELIKGRVMGIDMGIENALYIAFNYSKKRFHFKGDEVREFRKQMDRRKKALLNKATYSGKGKTGHGRKKRTETANKIHNKIMNFRDTINHTYARRVVDIAVKHQCNTIQMENLKGINANKKLLKDWTYYDLQQKIKQKASEKGIFIVKVNPKYTSQRCHICGYISKENRITQSIFHCQSCNEKVNADYNAAKNIATPFIEGIIKKNGSENEATQSL